ncbi:hypothetical protein DVH05_013754 [Phytophthora capsici]|nr:hypothetical protein DVH05_013754 [Phytophthora capsici]
MKALFGQIRADEATAGNLDKADFGQSQVPLPPFRAEGSDDEAVVYDSGATDGDNACSEMYDESPSDEAGDAHAEAVEMEKERHNIMRKRPKLDLPEALVSMGSLIAKVSDVIEGHGHSISNRKMCVMVRGWAYAWPSLLNTGYNNQESCTIAPKIHWKPAVYKYGVL